MCPREGVQRVRTVRNFGCGADWVLEFVVLCDMCALIRDDVL
jgi:hypothetical protein